MKVTRQFLMLALSLALVLPIFSPTAYAQNLLIDHVQSEEVETQDGEDKDNNNLVERMGNPQGPQMPGNPFIIPLNPEALKLLNGLSAHSAEPTPDMLEKAYETVWEQVANNYIDVSKLANWHEWKDKFDGKLKTAEDLEKALQEMLSSLGDHWTSYTSTGDMDEARERMHQGIIPAGISLEPHGEENFRIRSLIYGFPAYKSALRRGDVIKEINGVSLEGKTLEEAEDLVQDKIGNALRVVVDRNGTEHKVTLILAPPERDGVQIKMLPGNIGFIRLPEFSGQSAAQFANGLIELHLKANGHMNGLVIDVRGNPGGEIEAAMRISEIFLKEGTIFSTVTRKDRRIVKQETTVTPPLAHTLSDVPDNVAAAIRDYYEMPLVLLIDGSSASSSEILTGALKDNKRTVIMGTTTWGKGVGMMVSKIPPGGQLSITSLTYTTPSGFNLHGKGIAPDIVVERHSGAMYDEQLDAAIEYLQANHPDPFSGPPSMAQGPERGLDSILPPQLLQSIVIALLLIGVVCFGYHRHIQLTRDRQAAEDAKKKEHKDRY